MKRISTLLATFVLLGTLTFASNPFQISLPGTNSPEGDVGGFRLTLLNGKTSNVAGLNLTILGLSEVNTFKGLDLGWFFGASRVSNEFTGVSLTLFNWHEGYDKGLNVGFVNYVNNVDGLNLAAVNMAEGKALINLGWINVTKGESFLDLGLVNYSNHATVQIGFVNATHQLDGLQVGLINYAKNGILPVLPFVNFSKSF